MDSNHLWRTNREGKLDAGLNSRLPLLGAAERPLSRSQEPIEWKEWQGGRVIDENPMKSAEIGPGVLKHLSYLNLPP